MPLPAPLDRLPLSLQRRALRRVTRHFAEHPVEVAYRLACAEAESWRARYPAAADWLRGRAERMRGRLSQSAVSRQG